MTNTKFFVLLAFAVALAAADPCTDGTNNCSDNADCTVSSTAAGGFTCACKAGFTGNGVECEDIDECATNTHGCQQECQNRPGTFWCTCPEGYAKISATDCQEDHETISGKVFSSKNASQAYAGSAVFLYQSNAANDKLSLLGYTTTSSQGVYEFLVAHSRHYQICVLVNGFESCVHRVVPPPTSSDFGGNGGQRRITSLSSLNIPVPSYLGVHEYEVQVIWTMDNTAYSCDWDTALVTPYSSTCIAANKDTYSYGFCCDPNSSDCERNALVYQDSYCGNSAFGFESTILQEPGTGTYKHFVYGYSLSSSFDTITSLSQGQINIYRRGLLGSPYLEKTILLTNAIFGNSAARFWHTFTLNVNNGNFGSISETNVVSCTPQASTGTTSSLTLENGARGC